MSSDIATEASRTVTEDPDAGRVEDLVHALHTLEQVTDATAAWDRTPTRVEVDLDVANVPATVDDLIAEYDARIHDPEVNADGGLSFTLTTPERFRPAGVRDMREYGTSSVSITFPREALDLSGLDADRTVDVRAREGAILLVEYDA